MINENKDDAATEAIFMNNGRIMKFRCDLFLSAKVQANLHKLIPIFDAMGIFDWISIRETISSESQHFLYIFFVLQWDSGLSPDKILNHISCKK